MDHNLESKRLQYNEYIEIYENDYEIKKHFAELDTTDETKEDVKDEDEDDDEDEDAELVETNEDIETKDLDESSTYSETTNWWSFLWGH